MPAKQRDKEHPTASCGARFRWEIIMNRHMKNLAVIPLLILFEIMLAGCGTYTTTAKSLTSQLEQNQNVQMCWAPLGFGKYPSNQMDSVLCTNSKGELVYLFPDKNTEVRITSKSSGKKFKAYFDTVIYRDGKLYGLRSRILGGLQKIDVDDIDKIEFHSEFPKTRKVASSVGQNP